MIRQPISQSVAAAIYAELPETPLSESECAAIALRHGVSKRSIRRFQWRRFNTFDPLATWINRRADTPPTAEMLLEIQQRASKIRYSRTEQQHGIDAADRD